MTDIANGDLTALRTWHHHNGSMGFIGNNFTQAHFDMFDQMSAFNAVLYCNIQN